MSKVSLIKCETYQVDEVYHALKRGIEQLGGIHQFFNHNEKILLKPNLLASANVDKAVTTHPVVFEALVKILVSDHQYMVSYGDSPGIGSPSKVSENCGYKEIAQKYGVTLSEFNKGSTLTFPEGKQTKQFEIAKGVQEADAIVSMSKMKTHQLTRITGAVKNQLGCVYGLNKHSSHAKFPDAISFSKMLVDLNMLLKPRLYIMDGILAMEGNGPRSGSPTAMKVLLISNDPIALDAVFCRLIHLNPEFIPTITYGETYGLGRYQDVDIDLVGDEIGPLINKDFDVIRRPVIAENFGFAAAFRGLILRKPIIEKGKCVKCGICVQACPVQEKAVNFRGEKNQPPEFDYKKCIRCYCCQEMCPEKAIEVKTPWLGKLLLYR